MSAAPKRILLVTYGSLGDLHPMLALALGLKARGHDVIIATSEPYRAKVIALGLRFAAVRPDLSLSDGALVRRVMDGQRGTEYLLRKLVYPAVRDMHADLSALATSADLMVTSELACAAPLVAARQKIRWAYFALAPLSFLPVYDPPVLPGPTLLHWMQAQGPRANRFVYALARARSYSWWAPVRRFRRELGLPAAPSPIFAGKYSPELNLALFSPVLQPPQPDWPDRTVQTGFCLFPEDAAASLPAPVETFLRAGEPPIVFTLGSAAVHLARDFYDQSAEAAAALGQRAILLLGQNPPPPNLPPTILAWDYLPHAQIFPRGSVIVHQGGVGTTAQALRAGRPMLVVPFAHDQFDNAARMRRLGVGRELGRSRFRAATVAPELATLLRQTAYAASAARCGAQLRNEDGVSHTCAVLEEFLSP